MRPGSPAPGVRNGPGRPRSIESHPRIRTPEPRAMSGLVVKAAVLFAWTRFLGAIGRRAGPGRVGLLLGLPSTSAAALVACGRENGSGAAVVMADAGLLGLAAAV